MQLFILAPLCMTRTLEHPHLNIRHGCSKTRVTAVHVNIRSSPSSPRAWCEGSTFPAHPHTNHLRSIQERKTKRTKWREQWKKKERKKTHIQAMSKHQGVLEKQILEWKMRSESKCVCVCDCVCVWVRETERERETEQCSLGLFEQCVIFPSHCRVWTCLLNRHF